MEEIREAVPDHTAGRVTVRHDAPLDEEKIQAALEDAGYEYRGIA